MIQELREIITSPDKELYDCLDEIMKEGYFIHSITSDVIRKYGYEACYIAVISKSKDNKSFKRKVPEKPLNNAH